MKASRPRAFSFGNLGAWALSQTHPMSDTSPANGSAAIAQLRKTQPWLRLISVLMFIGLGFMVVAGVGCVLVGLVQFFRHEGARVAGAILFGGTIYLVLSLLYVYPTLLLHRGASAIRQLGENPDDSAVAEALNHQRRFWKYVGILAIVTLAFYAFVIACLIISGLTQMAHPTA